MNMSDRFILIAVLLIYTVIPVTADRYCTGSLISFMESSYSIRFELTEHNEHQTAVIGEIHKILADIPQPLLMQKPLTICIRTAEHAGQTLFAPGIDVRTGTWNRRISIYIHEEKKHLDTFDLTVLRRSLTVALARLYYRQLDPKTRREWMASSGWKTRFPFAAEPENINPEGYAGPGGMTSPEADFALFILEYLYPPAYHDPDHAVEKRFPDRALWIGNLPGFPQKEKALPYRQWIDPVLVEHTEVVITTPAASPASMAGHVHLLFRRKGDRDDGLNSVVLAFIGETGVDKNNGIDGIRYAVRGITGHYKSSLMETTLGEVIQRATLIENRDVRRYLLHLNNAETEALIRRLWVIRQSVTCRYRFFSHNCGTMLIDALNAALPADERITMSLAVAAPMHAVAKLKEAGRLGECLYPEYESLQTREHTAERESRRIQSEMTGIMKTWGDDAVPANLQNSIACALEDSLAQESGMMLRHPLFREPVLQTAPSVRKQAYETLAQTCLDLYNGYTGKDKALTLNEYCSFIGQVLEFLYHADVRERYWAVPSDISSSPIDPIPGNIREEAIGDALMRVRLRQENSPQLHGVRKAISRVRNHLDNITDDDTWYNIPQTQKEQRSAELAALRKRHPSTHGYYPLEAFMCYTNGGSQRIEAGFSSAIFEEAMGHKSMFALKDDLAMTILKGGLSLDMDTANFSEYPDAFRLKGFGTVFTLDKIFKRYKPGTPDRIHHGFGFTILESTSVIASQQGIFPGTDSCTKALEGRYLLSVFEKDGFSDYLNLFAGAGYSYRTKDSRTVHYAAIPAGIAGKCYPGGSLENGIRFKANYEHRFSREGWSGEAAAEFMVELGLTAKKMPVLRTGAQMALPVDWAGKEAQWDSPSFTVFMRFAL
ncbi:MAG: DUF4105 domain-containing protein [Spirochaetales bacterium]|nr:DUF4105 domain-containing protein [Spirochaetales bacterium]